MIALSVLLPLPQHISVLFERTPDELGLLPQVWRQEPVGIADRYKGSLESVLEGLGGARGRSVDVGHTSKLEQALHGGRRDKPSASGGRNELDYMVSFTIGKWSVYI